MGEGTDPKYVPFCELFEGGAWSFERIVEVAESMTQENAGSLQSGWELLGREAQTSISEFGQDLSTKLAEAWTGAAAQSASESITAYAKSSEDAGGYFQGVSTTLWGIATSVDAVKNTQSGVPEYISKGGIYNTLTPWDTAAEEAYHERHGQALRALTTFSSNLGRVDEHVPQFAPPESTLGTDRHGGFPGGGSGGGGGGGGSGSGGGGLPAGPGGPGDGALPGSADMAGSAGPGSGLPGASELADTLAAGTDPAAAATSPAGLGPAGVSPAGLGADGARAGLGSGGGGAGGGIGGGGFGGGAGGLGGGAGGPTGGGLMGGSAVGGPAGAGAAGGAGMGRPGMAGGAMGGMMGGAGAGRGQGDQNKEHKTAGYLVTLDNGNELIGKLPPVAPPVIGA